MSSRSNQVRIIAGQWRGRKLSFPDAQGLRPTPDRIRETLFNWLAPLLPGACCLDLFAGSGALGFEAASRGAARVVMVDHNPDIVRALRLNQQLLCADVIEIFQQEAGNYLSSRSGQFDLVFLDPPFKNSALLEKSIRMLTDSGSLNGGARIYLEMPSKAPEPVMPKCWAVEKQKKAGHVAYRLYRKVESPRPAASE
ncbi:MAG: 16S rRNA (guanine(966)-N(2))-methyltransferase RsmD [Pseudomonadota bacterium]|nr:16S rRNA (guanine(966)-N(2))-methyltransferase RsmD [Pseudomonadota bacterium]